MKLVLWTHPRCVGTAVELWARQRGDLTVDVNPFDVSYYAYEKRGLDPPERDTPVTEEDSFVFRHRRFVALGEDSARPVFVRAAAYTVRYHLEPELWRDVQHTFIIRDPLYTLPSHRGFVGDRLTEQEAGYEPQHALFTALRADGHEPLVFDAHELLADPERMLGKYCELVGLPWVPGALTWEKGMRPGWELWPQWKKEAAASTGFTPFRGRNLEVEEKGERDPLYPECKRYYDELYAARFSV